LRQETITFVMSVCSSIVRPSTWNSHLEGFSWNATLQNFSKIYRENSNFTEAWPKQEAFYMNPNKHFWTYIAKFFLEWEMLQTKEIEKIKTRILRSVTSFFENRALYDIMWKNIVEPGRPQRKIWCIRIACWITKATSTESQCVTHTVFTLQQCLQERASKVTLYVQCLSR
jgi:hypothetical protein